MGVHVYEADLELLPSSVDIEAPACRQFVIDENCHEVECAHSALSQCNIGKAEKCVLNCLAEPSS